jgi:AraC-like ligand binding domain
MSVKVEKQSTDSVRVFDDGQSGIRRMEAFFYGAPFSRHRHDTYAIGVTLAGLQCFFYRGSWHRARPGEIHVLFPTRRTTARRAPTMALDTASPTSTPGSYNKLRVEGDCPSCVTPC